MQKSAKHKLYYTITEASKTLGVSPSLIRFWESQLGVRPQNKNEKGDRRYLHSDLEKLNYIKNLVRNEGYTLKGVKNRMINYKQEINKRRELKSNLLEIKEHLKVVDCQLLELQVGKLCYNCVEKDWMKMFQTLFHVLCCYN